MPSLKDMRVRIGATKATQKITKAMQMVAASKLRRAQAAAEAARPYADRMETVLRNAACEPEIVDLAELLNKMGAKIEGACTPTITVTGVERLGGADHTIIPDRIETGTFIVAAAITGGELMITNCEPGHLQAVIEKLREVGVKIEQTGRDKLRVAGNGADAHHIAAGSPPSTMAQGMVGFCPSAATRSCSAPPLCRCQCIINVRSSLTCKRYMPTLRMLLSGSRVMTCISVM